MAALTVIIMQAALLQQQQKSGSELNFDLADVIHEQGKNVSEERPILV